jgi:diguanylate cyclase (GGDEF)-like protein
MHSKIFLRKEKEYKNIEITSSDKPDIDDVVLEKWQHIVNLISKLVDVPSGLITKITENSLDIFVNNNNRHNPYFTNGKDLLCSGLYCENAIGNNAEFHIENALGDDDWKDNPDIDRHMISYYGIPIQWPDKEFFGTLCVLDNKANAFNEDFKEIMKEFRNSIEKDLAILYNRKQLIQIAEHDLLTGAYNRRKMDTLLSYEFKRSKRTEEIFSIAIIDLNCFKAINDTYGHELGDKVLMQFADSFKSHIRSTDFFSRWGGDEFLLLCPSTSAEALEELIDKLKLPVTKELEDLVPSFSFSSGISAYQTTDHTYDQIIKRADMLMYDMKRQFYKDH